MNAPPGIRLFRVVDLFDFNMPESSEREAPPDLVGVAYLHAFSNVVPTRVKTSGKH